ncbi:MAG: hypothetical protein ACTH1R_12005 [Staphylococcus equorum]|uniref:hypothetical protein n=1 Tax=Staphylococcus TaxID=1279 RepID=UPI00189DC824|nr:MULTISPECIES: hypothetical protein [Staphylococcus]MBF7018273.1 hypothetical protein [Staphylococcus durrellii]MDK9847469.1 hypothetical protein [Staphylococcus equorum]
MNRIAYKKYDTLNFKGFVLYADEVRTFNGKRYKIKGVRALRKDNTSQKDNCNFIPLNEIMYEAKTVYSERYGIIARRKNNFSEIKCLKDLSA